ncbi:MAG TPA: SAM-dependent methyltransferase, partial [Burkholderiaceae bacterium]|nr:SAM-dependent methyltransferase [Burkholderiaceae bacterium]
EIAQAFTTERARDFHVVPAVEALAKAHVAQADTLVRGDYLRLWPHRHGTDGFFAAVWERR